MATAAPKHPSRRGLTLVELLIAVTISGVLLAAAFSSVFYFTQSGLIISGYSEMEDSQRRTSQLWSRDIFNANNAHWQNENHLVLQQSGGTVEYLYEPNNGQILRRDGSGSWETLLSGIVTLRFIPYNRAGTALDLSQDLNAANAAVKMIQMEVEMHRAIAFQPHISAHWATPRVLLRNREVEDL